MSRGMKFRIKQEEGLSYPCSENKGADQLRGYREADLRLCFCICKKPIFSQRGSYFLVLCDYVLIFRYFKSRLPLLEPVLGGITSVEHFNTGHEQTQ